MTDCKLKIRLMIQFVVRRGSHSHIDSIIPCSTYMDQSLESSEQIISTQLLVIYEA